VIITAIMSWVNPYAPMAPVLNALARPFLAPFQRFIPPLGGVDLSPIVLIIVLQLLLSLLAGLRLSLFAYG
jgi:YggT family protein